MTSLPPDNAPLSSPQTEPHADPQRSATAVLDRQLVEQPVEPGDHERFSHYVKKDKILESALSGAPVIALCGKVWVPGRDPKKFPVCPMCKEIYEGITSREKGGGKGDGKGGGKGDGGDSPS